MLFISLLLVSVFSSCEKTIDNTQYIYVPDTTSYTSYEYVVTDFGAIGDGVTDCSEAFKKAIAALPAGGGCIVVPEGEFLLNSPILIERNYVTIRGVNNGLRSNIDVDSGELTSPGGGSKLLLGTASYAIQVPSISNVDGSVNRISGVTIENLLISGGKSNKGTGIYIQHDNDGLRITNVVGINLNYGIVANAADAMIIDNCWISEVANSIQMTNGIQNMITNCQLGAQPSGVTVNLTNQENFVFEGNHVYPNGSNNIKLTGCNYANISNNNFQSYYVGIIDLSGDNNLVNGNIIWMRESSDQVAKGLDYGVIRVMGDDNMVSSNSISCDWVAVSNPVTINVPEGNGNRFSDLKISDVNSEQVFKVAETTEIFNCVSADKIVAIGDKNNVHISY